MIDTPERYTWGGKQDKCLFLKNSLSNGGCIQFSVYTASESVVGKHMKLKQMLISPF